MKLLILGGTSFVGRNLVETALAQGHEVTLFNRGKTDPDLFKNVTELHGDRDSDLSALRGGQWDVVIDTSGYVPRVVQKSAEVLADSVEHYIFISSISVYADFPVGGDETTPLATMDEESEDLSQYYGPLKVRCEQVLEEVLPGRVLIARPGMIVGPYDNINRFPYWVRRIGDSGDVLAPGRQDAPLQIIDARDIAEWLLLQAKNRATGIIDLTGDTMRFGDFLNGIQSALKSDANFVWVDGGFLAEQGVPPVDAVPYWIPPQFDGFFMRNIARAKATGLQLRPLAETARDTWDWLQTAKRQPGDPTPALPIRLQRGITREREQELLTAWRKTQ